MCFNGGFSPFFEEIVRRVDKKEDGKPQSAKYPNRMACRKSSATFFT